jgi:hypothetical protein
MILLNYSRYIPNHHKYFWVVYGIVLPTFHIIFQFAQVSPKKLLASTIGAATFQAALPQLALPRAQSDGPADLEQEKLSLPPVKLGLKKPCPDMC